MTITKERKTELIGDYRRSNNDTGSPGGPSRHSDVPGQQADRALAGSQDGILPAGAGLLMLVSRRRRLLDYLKRSNPQRYLDIIRRLDIRK